jgi:chromosomal replication initiation ATPase DnaA
VPTLRDIKREVCREFKVTGAEISGNSREYRIAHPRAIFVAIARKMLKASQERIGRELSGRDHSTISHLERRGVELVRSNPEYLLRVHRIREALRSTL